MARGRFLSKSISTNERFTKVSDRARVLWLMALPHADVDGLLPGSKGELGATAVPSLLLTYRWAIPDVESARDELVAAGLWILRVDAFDREVVEVCRFHDHQTLQVDKEGKSRYVKKRSTPESTLDPTPESTLEQRGPRGDAQVKVSKEKLSEEKSSEPARARMSEDRAEKEPVHPGDLQTAATDKDRLRAEFRLALDNPDWKGSGIDWSAAKENARFLSNLKDRPGQLARALEVVRSDGKAHPHILADVVQLLVAGLPTARAAPGSPKPYEIPLTTKPWEAIGLTEEEYRGAGGRA